MFLAVALVAAAFFACNREMESELTRPEQPVTHYSEGESSETGLGPEGFAVLYPHPLPMQVGQPFTVNQPQALFHTVTGGQNTLPAHSEALGVPAAPDSLDPGEILLPEGQPLTENRVRHAPVEKECPGMSCEEALAEQGRVLQELATTTCLPQGMYVRCCRSSVPRTYLLVATPGISCTQKELVDG